MIDFPPQSGYNYCCKINYRFQKSFTHEMPLEEVCSSGFHGKLSIYFHDVDFITPSRTTDQFHHRVFSGSFLQKRKHQEISRTVLERWPKMFFKGM